VLIEAFAGRRRDGGPDTKKDSLVHLMTEANVTHIDFLDLDIQGDELAHLTTPEARAFLDASVAHVHIGTHGEAKHRALRDMFTEMGWIKALDLESSGPCDSTLVLSVQTNKACWTKTNFGPIYVRDGMLSFLNGKRLGLTAPDFLSVVSERQRNAYSGQYSFT